MNRHTGGIILFIIFNCYPHLCTAAAYDEPCSVTSDCTDGYLECNTDKKCSCTEGYTVNNDANGCNAGLGTACSNDVSCHDQFADCLVTLSQCSCRSGYYDNNGSDDGGTCQLKKNLGEECPHPNTVPGTCSTGNSTCSLDGSSSTNYRCKCVSPNVEQNGNCVEATWSEWTNWECSVTCGSGTKTRTRTCSVAGSCTGDATQTESCSNGDCPVDGMWGGWSQWSACSPTCGDSSGQQNRSRNCDNPPPSNNGQSCDGSSTEIQQCSISKCPVDGGLSGWSAWSPCSVSCAGGSQTRSRTCSNPTPQYDGKDCTGHLSETQDCQSQDCPEVEFGQQCTTDGDKCKGTFTGCIGGTCKCISGYYRNGNACEAKIALGSTGCSTTVSDSCKSPHATCRSSGGSCTCNSGYYDDNGSQTGGGTCTRKIELGSTGCSITVSDSCQSPDATCQSNGGSCTCNSGYYDDNGSWAVGGICRQKIELGSTGCSRTVTDSCMSPYATCQLSGYCTCNSGYYDDNGSQTGGGTCTRKIALGSTGCSTAVSDSCKSPDATCQSSGYCTCNSGYFDDNGSWAVGGICRQKIELGSSGCSIAVSDSCRSPNAACQSHGGSCKCINGYYDDNGSLAGGTCMQRKDLGVQCSNIPNECADTNAACLDDKCTCGFYYYDDSGFNPGGSCESASNLRVSNVGFSSIQINKITVTWTIPQNYKQYINKFKVTWRPTNNVNTESADLGSSITSFTMTKGIDPGRAYTVTIISINDQTQLGSSRNTSVVRYQAAKPNITSGIDDSNSDKDISGGSIKVAWNNVPGYYSGYIVKLKDGETVNFPSAVNSVSATFSSSGLKNGYRYDVTIQAESEQYDDGKTVEKTVLGDIFSSKFKTTPKLPEPPENGVCNISTDSSILLDWEAPTNPNGDLVQYNIHVFIHGILVFNNISSTGTQTDKTVGNLEPGTSYTFRLYTVNEVGQSTTDLQVSFTNCKTRARMSTKPENLQIKDVTSRSFLITWEKPMNTYSAENYGYVLQVKDDKGACKKEVLYNCSDCEGSFQVSNLSGLCDQNKQPDFNLSKAQLARQLSYNASLNPDTNYTVTVTAINDEGRGHFATMSQITNEEAPQTPYDVKVIGMTATTFNITWSIDGPRPGQTSYLIMLKADSPAESKNFTATGFEMRQYTAIGLQEYWNYSVSVMASTSVSSSTSAVTNEYRTLTAAPGKVSKFNIDYHPDGDYTKMTVSWKKPTILERNGIIKSYNFEYFETTMVTRNESFGQKTALDYLYSKTIDVKPEKTYNITVYAINNEDMIGEKHSEKVDAPAGVPPNIEETENATVVPKTSVKNIEKTSFTVAIKEQFFIQNTYGNITDDGLAICTKKDCGVLDIKKKEDFSGMEDIKKNKNMYRLTRANWLVELREENKESNSRKRRAIGELEYTVGEEDCSKLSPNEFCNGPLQPGTTYFMFGVACTNGGCLVSQPYGPFITEAEPEEKANLGLIIGIVVACVVIIVLVAVIAVLLLRRRKRHGDGMKPSPGDDDDDDFTKLDPSTANIKRKRPINLNEIEEYVGNMHKDSNLLFSAEYEELKTLSPKHACEAADREENRMRNRYINIIPFDHSRVKLSTNGEDDSADYINGNYLPGYNSPREYIGCQGPIPGTIDDFWRMTWEQNVSVIVMLTLCKEGQKIKCEQYWPDEVGEPKQYGDVIVEITSYSNIRTYDYRMFRITNGSTTRVVKHFHFLSWLDFQANVHHDIILDFIQHVRQHVQPPDTSGPMIIHCSAGVGRTGTYIALDHLMQFINEHDFDVEIDIFDLVLKLRENRQHMVQTEQQYVFIHDCVKEIMERKRRQMENIYENQGFSQDENIYQNEQSLYANVSISKAEQNTEL